LFSPCKQNLTLIIPAAVKKQPAQLKKLGKHKTGKNCFYINKLEEVDMAAFKEIINKGLLNNSPRS
jgi:hypothetical protein